MKKQGRTQLGLGIVLILLGAWFIAQRVFPELATFTDRFSDWPFTVIGVGILLLFLGLILGAPGLAVPAAIVSGIGGLFYYFEYIGSWADWYMWLLVPGFAGFGTVLQGLLGENTLPNGSKRNERMPGTTSYSSVTRTGAQPLSPMISRI